MRTRLTAGALSFALVLAIAATIAAVATPALGASDDGVIVTCPANLLYTGTQLPPGWGVALIGNATFRDAFIRDSKIWCNYASQGAKPSEVTAISKPVPAGMNCTHNAGNKAQFDCYPGAAGGTVSKNKSQLGGASIKR